MSRKTILVTKSAFLACCVMLSLLALVVFIPDGNDYALATGDKHDRLESLTGPKIVFVGGSNLAFGLDSAAVESVCGGRVVNMGMNGWLGVRFIMAEVEHDLHPGDTVVLSFEYDNYFKSPDGTGADLLMLLKARPASLRYLTLSQLAAVAKAIPFGAQQKIFRLTRGAASRAQALFGMVARAEQGASSELSGSASETDDLTEYNHALINQVERYSGFNKYGDLTSHLDVSWPYPREDGLDITSIPVDQSVLEAIRTFADKMKQRGVRVVMLPTSLIKNFHDRHSSSLRQLDRTLRKTLPDVPISHPERYVFPESAFFDTVYHLTREGRAQRTQKVIEDLQAHTGLCEANLQVSN